jgi:plastocyanin
MIQDKSPNRNNRLLTVTISFLYEQGVEGRMYIAYTPAVLHARHGDSVSWTCGGGPFAIDFKGQSPVGKVQIQSNPGHETHTGDALIHAGARPGHYHYAVAVHKDGVVYVDAECPEIIIEEE